MSDIIGIVDNFSTTRRYGFVIADDLNYLITITDLEVINLSDISKGTEVSFIPDIDFLGRRIVKDLKII